MIHTSVKQLVWEQDQVLQRCFAAEPIVAVAASPDGVHLAGGGASGAVYLWETPSGRLLRSWPAHYKVHAQHMPANTSSQPYSATQSYLSATSACLWSTCPSRAGGNCAGVRGGRPPAGQRGRRHARSRVAAAGRPGHAGLPGAPAAALLLARPMGHWRHSYCWQMHTVFTRAP